MIAPGSLLLTRLLRQPEMCASLSMRDWDLLIRQARSGGVLARTAAALTAAGVLQTVPARPRAHLASAATVASQHRASATYEIDAILRALTSTRVVPILLKGAAYHAAGLEAAHGRLFADVDILVPAARLGDVESALIRSGWQSLHHDAYTERYYRRWMHELPPMLHLRRATSLDVHHTILPPTAGRRLNADKLIDSAVTAAQMLAVKVLAPVDMVLHSMTHLFYDGELEHGFRDLVDLDSLLRQFAAQSPGFWPALAPRAKELDLERPLYYGLRYVAEFMGTPVPSAVLDAVDGPPMAVRSWLDALFRRALCPAHASCSDSLTSTARRLLYVRAHWLRMPPHLLAYHLARKALVHEPDVADEAAAAVR